MLLIIGWSAFVRSFRHRRRDRRGQRSGLLAGWLVGCVGILEKLVSEPCPTALVSCHLVRHLLTHDMIDQN